MDRRSAFSELPRDVALSPLAPGLFQGRVYPSYGGVLGSLYSCLPREQTVPDQLNAGENSDIYFAARLACDALVDAGMRPHSPTPVRGTVRVGYAPAFTPATVNWLEHAFFLDQTLDVLAACSPQIPAESFDSIRSQLVDSLPRPDAEAFLSGSPAALATWVARECSFGGAATACDAGCLSFFSALEQAVDDLRSCRADVALAGALEPPLSRAALQGLAGRVRFSGGSELTPFDSASRGTLPGEGGGFLVLKRRLDALAAHDRIYALVRSVVTGSDPVRLAADMAGAPLPTIALAEADGTGIPDMDAAEVEYVSSVWGEHRPGGALTGIGSVKGNVGHSFRAAGMAGVAKTAMALSLRVLPPQIGSAHPPEAFSNLASSVYLLDEARPWVTGNPATPRRAVVLGRSRMDDAAVPNGAVLLEEEPEDRI